MQYPQEELLGDYQVFASSAVPLDGLSQDQLAGLLRGFFQLRYRDPKIAAERMPVFLRVTSVLEQHRPLLVKAGYVSLGSAKPSAPVQDDLIRALHRLIVEKEMIDPPLRNITEAADFFSTRN